MGPPFLLVVVVVLEETTGSFSESLISLRSPVRLLLLPPKLLVEPLPMLFFTLASALGVGAIRSKTLAFTSFTLICFPFPSLILAMTWSHLLISLLLPEVDDADPGLRLATPAPPLRLEVDDAKLLVLPPRRPIPENKASLLEAIRRLELATVSAKTEEGFPFTRIFLVAVVAAVEELMAAVVVVVVVEEVTFSVRVLPIPEDLL